VTLTHLQKAERLGAELRKELLETAEKTFEKPARVAVPVAETQPEVLPLIRQDLSELYRQ